MPDAVPASLRTALEALILSLASVGIPAIIIGGVAASLLGRSRLTRDIDVVLGGLPFERAAVAAGQLHSLGDFDVRLPRVEDLMIMKAVAQRPRDLLEGFDRLVAQVRSRR